MQKFKELREKYRSKFPPSLVAAAVKIALDMGGNMTGAYKKIENMKRGLADDPIVKDALRQANEETVKEATSLNKVMSAIQKDLKKEKIRSIKDLDRYLDYSGGDIIFDMESDENKANDLIHKVRDKLKKQFKLREGKKLKPADQEKLAGLFNSLMDVKHGSPQFKKIKAEIQSLLGEGTMAIGVKDRDPNKREKAIDGMRKLVKSVKGSTKVGSPQGQKFAAELDMKYLSDDELADDFADPKNKNKSIKDIMNKHAKRLNIKFN